MSLWLPMHVHSHFSQLDGTTNVIDLVDKCADMKQPGMSLNDHGNMAGTVAGYKRAKQRGILFYPGLEAYLADPDHEGELTNDVKRFHLGLVALDLKGYSALVRFTSRTHTRPRFSRFPRATFSDLMELGRHAGKHLILTTGCYFGLAQQRMVNEGPDEALRVIKAYARYFPNTFVEIQHHNIDHEDGWTDTKLVQAMVEIADEAGLRLLATQDTHYLNQTDKVAHSLMKKMVYATVEDGFPGDSFHMATDEWVAEHYDFDPTIWPAVEDSCQDIVNMHRLAIPPLDKFKVHMPSLAGDPYAKLKHLVEVPLRMMTAAMSDRKRAAYEARLMLELDVVKHTGMADYFLHWDQFVKWCRKELICIEARGSANGSLICYLLGVTQVDPVKHGTYFERFISKDRIKPPDIDMDIEADRRDEAIKYLGRSFETMRIGTWGKIGVTIDEQTGEERGSVLVTYMSYLRRKCQEEAEDIVRRKQGKKGEVKDLTFAIFNKKFGHIKTMADVGKIDPRGYRGLKRMAAWDSVYKSYGQHAGGVLLGPDDLDIEDYVPTMLVGSSDAQVTQYDMDALEEFGLLKDDILGQTSLTMMRICQELMGRPDPTDFTWIPDNDPAACKILREGRVDNGIFHFEGWTKAKGGKEMGIRNTKDAIIASALYMPGCVESGQKDRYIATRRSSNARAREIAAAKAQHAVVWEVLEETNGVMVFQEHPLMILRKIGMSVESVNATYKILKDSGKGAIERNRKRLAELEAEYLSHCKQIGVKDPVSLWRAITGFMAYGFNKAHSTGYGIRSYRTAYLKAHYPLEYMAALLQVWAGRKTQKKDREAIYVREARHLGLRVLPPDINLSGASWSIDRQRGALRRGLLSIRGIGPVVATRVAQHAPYVDLEDLIAKVGGKYGNDLWRKHKQISGTVKLLKEADALQSIGIEAPV